jgi:hypothetical protein
MTSTPAVAAHPVDRAVRTAAATTTPPWYLWVSAAAATSSTVGLWWDISWHDSIGRDTFWTPAHMAIYGCGVLVGIVSAYLVLATTFAQDSRLRANSVRVLGWRAPLGTFLSIWGGATMLTAVPFDNWWHATYGLDAAILTPPHLFVVLGMRAVSFGILLLTLAWMNRALAAGSEVSGAARKLLLYVGGLLVLDQMVLTIPTMTRFSLHNLHGYTLSCVAVVPVLVLLSQISRSRWAATWATAEYTVVLLLMIWILPLFPATPRLGPVFTPVTHMVPPGFPILLLPAGFALDLWLARGRRLPSVVLALGAGGVFVAVLVALEWPFADFLMSPLAANRVFGTTYHQFFVHPIDVLPVFHQPQAGAALVRGLVQATLLSAMAAWVALKLGAWMREVQR